MKMKVEILAGAPSPARVYNAALHLTVPSGGPQWVSMNSLGGGGTHISIYGVGVPEMRALAAAIASHIDARLAAATPAGEVRRDE